MDEVLAQVAVDGRGGAEPHFGAQVVPVRGQANLAVLARHPRLYRHPVPFLLNFVILFGSFIRRLHDVLNVCDLHTKKNIFV